MIESGTTISTDTTPSSAALSLGEVVSEHERVSARIAAPAEPALRWVKKAENPVERRIVTLVKRVTY